MTDVAPGTGTAAPGLALESDSPEATEALGEALAPALETGDLVVLSGPLGAGKTRFVAGLARGMGAKGRVRSPSFTLINEYRAGERLLLHIDLYRIDAVDVDALGLEEALERGVLVVEWGEKLPSSLRREALAIAFGVTGELQRTLTAGASGATAAARLVAWRAAIARKQ